MRYVRWGAISTEDLHEAIASIEDWELQESDLDRALRRMMQPPHLASYIELIRSFDGQQGIVRGEVIRIDTERICMVFGIPHGRNPLSICIHHGHAVSMVIMAVRRARCVSAQLLMYLQARFGTGGQVKTIKYNIAHFIAGSISREVEWVNDHLEETHPQRFCETFVGIPLTVIFLHRGVITEAECETGFTIPETGWDFPADGHEDDEDEERDIPDAGKP
ncbi:hypothetical protein R1sor_002435 [Riccia sorocarpa]|uniref:Uncharacterized protein n=1 Tax=Riccia sorocarpa TaxID=122646 RepID=A0ABD3GZN1_9MARC